MKKILPISLKLNFSPNTLGCYGLAKFIEYLISLAVCSQLSGFSEGGRDRGKDGGRGEDLAGGRHF